MTPTEHHLGDRLAALVDGELGHDARERVLSHLATCRSCKAEADAQRRLKNVFADTAPPPPSEGLLARLQGLPAGGGADSAGRAGDNADDTDRGPGGPGAGFGPGADGREALPVALPGGSGRSPFAFDYLPVGKSEGRGPLTPPRGFRIHEVHRVDRTERAALRGRRRFAFAAAGAFSLAALAIGGALTTGTTGTPAAAKGDGSGASASPVRTAPAGGGASRDSRRRTPLGEHRTGVLSASAAASLSASTFAAGAARGGLAGGRTGASAAAPPLLSSLAATQSPLQQAPVPRLRPQNLPPVTETSWYAEAGGPEALVSATAPSSTLRSFPGRVPMATAPSGTAVPPVR
ncbi:anti-sigma factor family protein [Streptomyces iconiensis]|uniref:Zf-HC2 domain-containing protein n=1 Tax=Streptomyces iconiensis TaxID=1384038 RepID=A0ABT7A5R6_9ACTN|nr:zf-HC2 domain-containing protein [Streptomyces iconiensis]MDJ1136688.1 zf-HC2 domain-containing protein [Streptomyces iconiensis]